MDFEKHAFGFGVTTGLFLSYLDIQLAHYLQSLLWPIWSPEMNEADLINLVQAVEALAEPNWADKALVVFSFIAAVSVIAAFYSAYIARKVFDENKKINSNKISTDQINSYYERAFVALRTDNEITATNDNMSWINAAKRILKAKEVEVNLTHKDYIALASGHELTWQQEFRKLICNLDCNFFYHLTSSAHDKEILKSKLQSNSYIPPDAISILYLFVYKPQYLSNFIKKIIEDCNTAESTWDAFGINDFYIPETWDSAFDKNGVIDIRKTGAYKYVKSRLTIPIDLHEQKDTEGIENKDYLSFETKLTHGLNKMRFKFTNWTMQNPKPDKEELANEPSYHYYLVIEPIDLLLIPNNQYYKFSFQARIDEIFDKYWRIKSVNDKENAVSLFMEKPKNIEEREKVEQSDEAFTVYVNQFELYDKNFEVIEAQFENS
ncbi:hypothetical protein MED121_09775 [Marinomonas sp. MED121]|uniref:hypothetical protein n=1 Tax=Marinomonas sp. MED121 TaxID=314277 RepID=UPI000068FB56|nr:hypothetical protein [Marinomonas sp. MED121]EAQ64999.1 hypothetical protein MED121_09775 [Marinomonas sp. MED121]